VNGVIRRRPLRKRAGMIEVHLNRNERQLLADLPLRYRDRLPEGDDPVSAPAGEPDSPGNPAERAFDPPVGGRPGAPGPEMPADPALARLFPPAYHDQAAAAEYARLMGSQLAASHRSDLELLAATASADRLTPEQAETWLRALNDIRLVLGTELGVEQDWDVQAALAGGSPAVHVYVYLSWLQEELVEVLAGQ